MNFKYTPKNLNKLENILEDSKYVLRYEKGHFNSGFCILEDKKIVVINRFLALEGKINVLLELIPTLQIVSEELSYDLQPIYFEICNMTIEKP